MKAISIIILCAFLTACARQEPDLIVHINLAAHWTDTTIVQDHPSYALACESGLIVGKMMTYGGNEWFATMPEKMNSGTIWNSTNVYTSMESAKIAVEKAVLECESCARRHP